MMMIDDDDDMDTVRQIHSMRYSMTRTSIIIVVVVVDDENNNNKDDDPFHTHIFKIDPQ